MFTITHKMHMNQSLLISFMCESKKKRKNILCDEANIELKHMHFFFLFDINFLINGKICDLRMQNK